MYRILLLLLVPVVLLIAVFYLVIAPMGNFVNQGSGPLKEYQFNVPYKQILPATWIAIHRNKKLQRVQPEPGYNGIDYYNDSLHYITCSFLENDSSISKFVFHFLGDSTLLATSTTAAIVLKYASNSRYNSTKENDHLIRVFEREVIAGIDSVLKGAGSR